MKVTTPDTAKPQFPVFGEPSDGYVRARGARENNLRNVDVPRDAIVAFTGIPGNGKSSLAFGTIFAEARRRYFESVAPYARRLIQQGNNPRVEAITGLPSAVALQQRPWHAEHPVLGGHRDDVVELPAHDLLPCRALPGGCGHPVVDSFFPNTLAAACPVCHGLGTAHTVSEQLLVPDPLLTIRESAVAAWPGAWQGKTLRDILIQLGHDVDMPWNQLPREQRE